MAYSVQGRHASVYFTSSGVVYSLRQPASFQNASITPSRESIVNLQFLDANPNPFLEAAAPTGALVSYFRGAPDRWVTGLPAYSTLRYHDVWPGIDVEFTGDAGNLKYTLHVLPGVDTSRIAFAYRGASRISLTSIGSLHVETPNGSFADDAPVAWQEVQGRRVAVHAKFELRNEEVRFALGPYDPSLSLTLDPLMMVYSGYLGGGNYDIGRGIAVDPAGNAYVTGYTSSAQNTFPITAGFDGTFGGGVSDAFVAKINPAGTSLLYAAYIGGDAEDNAFAIAVDSDGEAYVAGYTKSTEATFPVTTFPDTTHNGLGDAFVVKINSAGTALVYSGYIGGPGEDFILGIALDASRNAYVSGYTGSTEVSFPVLVGPDTTHNGAIDAFVAKINSTGTALLYCGYIGGAGNDFASRIAVDAAGNAYVTGNTLSNQASFPVITGPDLTHNGDIDAFVAKVNPSGSALVYSGYIGGSGKDYGIAIAVDPAGYAYVAGNTASTAATFPSTNPPGTGYNGGDQDVFIAKVNPTGANLAFAGFLGGNNTDAAYGIGLDAANNIYVAGNTKSTEATFPLELALDTTHNGDVDAFVTKIVVAANRLTYSTFLGGSGYDAALALAVDQAGNAYITGNSASNVAFFPTNTGPDLTYNGGGDAIVAKIAAFPSTAGPTFAYRNGYNAIETNTFPSFESRNSGGSFRLNPVVAMTASGNAFIASRDSGAGIWINYLKPDNTYNGWVFAGGSSPGNPALASSGETAWIAVRDPWNSYYVRSYTPGAGFTPWTWLQGILATDPQLAGCPNGDIYIAGKDNWNGVWTRRYSANLAAWQAWLFIGGIIHGSPAIACGVDNAAYIAVRGPEPADKGMWLARVAGQTFTWSFGGGIFDLDSNIQVVANGGLIQVSGLSFFVPVVRTWQIGAGWLDWTYPGGVLAHVTPAAYGNYLYLTGQDSTGNIWWWSGLSNSWTNFGTKNVAPGSRFSAGYR